MFGADVWRRMVGVDKATVIESVEVDEELNAVVAHVRPRKSTKRRCGRCGVRAPGYDQGEGRRRWRALDLGTVQCYLEADSPRVNCPAHGRRSPRSPGRGTARATPGTSTTRSPGSSPTPRSPLSLT